MYPVYSRPQLAGRITALRDALDRLAAQVATDGRGSFVSTGALKVELIGLEGELRRMDGSLTESARMVNAQVIARQVMRGEG